MLKIRLGAVLEEKTITQFIIDLVAAYKCPQPREDGK
jgi:hypothetical protein